MAVTKVGRHSPTPSMEAAEQRAFARSERRRGVREGTGGAGRRAAAWRGRPASPIPALTLQGAGVDGSVTSAGGTGGRPEGSARSEMRAHCSAAARGLETFLLAATETREAHDLSPRAGLEGILRSCGDPNEFGGSARTMRAWLTSLHGFVRAVRCSRTPRTRRGGARRAALGSVVTHKGASCRCTTYHIARLYTHIFQFFRYIRDR